MILYRLKTVQARKTIISSNLSPIYIVSPLNTFFLQRRTENQHHRMDCWRSAGWNPSYPDHPGGPVGQGLRPMVLRGRRV